MDEQELTFDDFQDDLEDQLFAEFKKSPSVVLFSDERLSQLYSLEHVEALVSFATV